MNSLPQRQFRDEAVISASRPTRPLGVFTPEPEERFTDPQAWKDAALDPFAPVTCGLCMDLRTVRMTIGTVPQIIDCPACCVSEAIMLTERGGAAWVVYVQARPLGAPAVRTAKDAEGSPQ